MAPLEWFFVESKGGGEKRERGEGGRGEWDT